MYRVAAIAYGISAYVVAVGSYAYFIGFITGWFVRRHIDAGPVIPLAQAVAVDLLLLTVFVAQHSGMARRGFKRVLSKFVPPDIERSTYVLFSGFAIILLVRLWRPIPIPVWTISAPEIAVALHALALIGMLVITASTFMVNHFALLGLRQVVTGDAEQRPIAGGFQPAAFYKVVRHPMYFGFLFVIWLTPSMTVGHLLFAAVMTGYIFVGTWLEERDLVITFGDDYRRYRERVAMLIPFLGGSAPRGVDQKKRS